MNFRFIITPLLYIFLIKNSYGQVRQFEVVLNAQGIDHPRSIQQTSDSGFIVCGSSNSYDFRSDMDPYLVKFNSVGNVEWIKDYGSTAIENMQSVIILNDGGYLLSGTSNQINGEYSPYLIRTDFNGNVLWDTIYSGNDWEFVNSSVLLQNGNIAMTGTTYRVASGGPDAYVTLIDSTGNIIWKKIYSGINKDEINSVKSCSNGDFLLCGTTYSYGSGGSDIWLLRINNNGDTLWTKTFGGSLDDFGYSAEETFNKDIIFCGSYQTPDSVLQFITARTDSNGILKWEYIDNRTSKEELYSIHETADSNIIAAGYTGNSTGGNEDFYLLRIDRDGIFLWAKTYGISETEKCYQMIVASDQGYAMVGETFSYGNNFPNLYIIKTDTGGVATGNILYGIHELNQTDNLFSVYPNPANEIINVKINSTLNLSPTIKIEIFDLTGILRKSISITDIKNKTNITTTDLTPGFYFVVLNNLKSISVQPIIIQH